MEYKEIITNCYRIFKLENIWNEKDRVLINRAELFLQQVVEAELKKIGFLPADKPSINNIIPPTILNIKDLSGYDKLALETYKIFKHFSQWNNQDKKRILLVEELLQKEIESELEKIGIIKSEPEIVKIESTPEPLSLLQRIISEQDTIVDDNSMTPKKTLVERYAKVVTEPVIETTRYYVTIICHSVKSKPAFQIFKAHTITNKDFKTDEILSTNCTFTAVIDSPSRADISVAVDKHFVNAYISECVQHDSNWIPAQYQTIFQNKTKLN